MFEMNGEMNVACLSTYPPRECGLATFAEDFVNSLTRACSIRPWIIAIANDDEQYTDPRVVYCLNQHERESYIRTAQWLNKYADLLVIEHEYGIFGGDCGEYIIDLVKNLKIPFIITTHTVLEDPLPKQQEILKTIGRLSAKLVTMARSSMPILVATYDIPPDKIMFIPHGVPSLLVGGRDKLKASHNFQDRPVISSFGLLSPAKGIEYGIEAIAKIAADFANVIYLILGKTHPGVQRLYGESYRHSLMNLAVQLGVEDNICFVDKFLTQEEVMKYLHLSDIYMTPYLSKEQAVSGTLAYAVGCGRVVVSTPYRYAREMLGDGRGMLAKFRDADSLANCLSQILSNPGLKRKMELKTRAVGKTMTWDNVARSYSQLFDNIVIGLDEPFTSDGSELTEAQVLPYLEPSLSLREYQLENRVTADSCKINKR